MGVQTPRLVPNVGHRPPLAVPAHEITKEVLKSHRHPVSSFSAVCEYMVTNPEEGRKLLRTYTYTPWR
jgi:hypothetical protein